MCENEAYSLAETLLREGIMELDILGGEPMLIPYMKHFLTYATNAGLTVNISTNGSLPGMVHALAKIPTRLLTIGFSLHGFSDTHNAITRSDNFKSVLEGIRRSLGEGKHTIIKSVLKTANRREIRGLIHYLRERGVKTYFLLHEDILGRKNQTESLSFPDFMTYFSALRSELHDVIDIGFVAASGFFKYGMLVHGRCDAGTGKLAVLPDGSTFPCNLLFGFREFCLGNILRDNIETILKHPVLQKFRTLPGNICKSSNCIYSANCSGGCPAHSYAFYRDIGIRDPRCRNDKRDPKKNGNI
jgi:uncharacterized protein